jgi:hypothetical protein
VHVNIDLFPSSIDPVQNRTSLLISFLEWPQSLITTIASADSDLDLCSDDNGCSSEDELDRSTLSKQNQWPDLDKQRLVVYKKENLFSDWVFVSSCAELRCCAYALIHGPGKMRLVSRW